MSAELITQTAGKLWTSGIEIQLQPAVWCWVCWYAGGVWAYADWGWAIGKEKNTKIQIQDGLASKGL